MLAMQIGGCTVAELQSRMSSKEFTEWKVINKTYPFAADRNEAMLAQLTASYINAHRRKWDAIDPRKLLVSGDRRKRRAQGAEEIHARISMFRHLRKEARKNGPSV